MSLYLLYAQIANNDDSPYREYIRANRGFYVHWLLPRIRAYFDHQGWMQPLIRCLGEDGYPPGHPMWKEEAAEGEQEKQPDLSSTSNEVGGGLL